MYFRPSHAAKLLAVFASSRVKLILMNTNSNSNQQQDSNSNNKEQITNNLQPTQTTIETNQSNSKPLRQLTFKALPTRACQIQALKSKELDVLVIGGGATGCGVALDCATRGLSTGLVELDDFASGASSKSTKLIHGGVRYLQKAIFQLDYEQYKMVREALRERANLLEIAPHLSAPLPIMLPVYKWYLVPWYWMGLKAYDFVAGRRNLKSSYYLSPSKALECFPMLKKDNLCGAIIYYDGAHNDARMCLSIGITAARYGAHVANHVAVVSLLKDANTKQVCGARVRCQLTNHEFDIKAKCVVNATGPHTDSIRRMDDPQVKKICQPSSGVHVVLPGYYSPESMGLLDPSTKDGRVIFFLPWQKYTIAGTTDHPCEPSFHPSPTEDEIQFILNEVRNYLSPEIEIRRGDVLAAWSGIRPLVLDPSKPNTESLSRNHIIHTSDSGLITIAGGKWTTYRQMAEDTVDTIVANHKFNTERPCSTIGLTLEGGAQWSPTLSIQLVQDFGLEPEVARNLAESYGDRAFAVAKLAKSTGKKWPKAGIRIHSELPYIEAEVRFATREYAMTAVDVIARRLRISFLNVRAAEEALQNVVKIMAEELNWSAAEQKKQLKEAIEFLELEMGLHHATG
ncbi:Glycerol-3-phosphate dehydrogenase, mitochondrial, partial [Fragariocoptes setiger]